MISEGIVSMIGAVRVRVLDRWIGLWTFLLVSFSARRSPYRYGQPLSALSQFSDWLHSTFWRHSPRIFDPVNEQNRVALASLVQFPTPQFSSKHTTIFSIIYKQVMSAIEASGAYPDLRNATNATDSAKKHSR